MRNSTFRSIGTLTIVSSILTLSACSHINVNQMAYEALRKEDCRINALEDFCARNFALEYREYELLRRDFMRSQTQTAWRVSADDVRTDPPSDEVTIIQ